MTERVKLTKALRYDRARPGQPKPRERRVTSIERAIADWQAFATSDGSPAAKRMVARVVAALDLEITTGKPHCSCCQKPFGGHGSLDFSRPAGRAALAQTEVAGRG